MVDHDMSLLLRNAGATTIDMHESHLEVGFLASILLSQCVDERHGLLLHMIGFRSD